MRVSVTGATGLIGTEVVERLKRRGDEVIVLSRDPRAAEAKLATPAARWDPAAEPAPADALRGCDAVLHLAGENLAQRWTPKAREAIRESRVAGTRNLLAGLRLASEQGPAPQTLVSSSAVGYYGPHREEPLDEDAPAGEDFQADVCVVWEREAARAAELGLRTVQIRTGVVLDRDAGALAKMLPPFRLGIGGPVAGGEQYLSWIHIEDVAEIMISALEGPDWTGPVNATAPTPVTNREFSHALGRALHRPAMLPIPGFALRLLYGDMAELITGGARVLPAKALVLGYRFRHPALDEALLSALDR